MTVIRKKPPFDIYIEDDFLVINNTDYIKDNCRYEISNIIVLELIRHVSFLNKIIEITFGFYVPAKSNELRIKTENGFKDILLTNCDIEKVEIIIYEFNKLLLTKAIK